MNGIWRGVRGRGEERPSSFVRQDPMQAGGEEEKGGNQFLACDGLFIENFSHLTVESSDLCHSQVSQEGEEIIWRGGVEGEERRIRGWRGQVASSGRTPSWGQGFKMSRRRREAGWEQALSLRWALYRDPQLFHC